MDTVCLLNLQLCVLCECFHIQIHRHRAPPTHATAVSHQVPRCSCLVLACAALASKIATVLQCRAHVAIHRETHQTCVGVETARRCVSLGSCTSSGACKAVREGSMAKATGVIRPAAESAEKRVGRASPRGHGEGSGTGGCPRRYQKSEEVQRSQLRFYNQQTSNACPSGTRVDWAKRYLAENSRC